MIDIHCHILPAMDDGASDSADSIEMARAAVYQGIRPSLRHRITRTVCMKTIKPQSEKRQIS